MNLPNLITTLRLVLSCVIFYLIAVGTTWWELDLAAGLLVVAGISDFLDGYLARKNNLVTAFGRIADPFADKFLVLASLLMLIAIGTLSGIHVIAAIIILGREFLVAGLREFLANSSLKLPVSKLAKWKTTIQMVSIGFLIAGPAGADLIPGNVLIGKIGLWATGTGNLLAQACQWLDEPCP